MGETGQLLLPILLPGSIVIGGLYFVFIDFKQK